MQLLALAVYNGRGDVRVINFNAGRLNIITGQSRSGKSALLDMFEYCMGRDTIMMPIGPITATVTWYAALLQLSGGRAFVARPAPQPGRTSSQQAMLEFGAALDVLPADRLLINTDTTSLRIELGRRIGIEENLHEPEPGSLRLPLEANLGHATLLSLQNQDEIAKRNQLFHRQGEPGMEQALKDTIPYFLGAAPRDQALKRARLRDARRQLARAQAALATAQTNARTVEAELRGLLSEAHAVGLTEAAQAESRSEVIAALTQAVEAPSQVPTGAREEQDRRRQLEAQRTELRSQLRAVAAERSLLLEQSESETAYVRAVTGQMGRLEPLGLLDGHDGGDAESCPVCGSQLEDADASVAELQAALEELQRQMEGVDAARPARREALTAIDTRIDGINDQLRAVEGALRAIADGDNATDEISGEGRRQFTRGRVSLALRALDRSDETALQRLAQQVGAAERLVQRLEAELDDAEEQMQLDSRLLALSDDMTRWAEILQLEHAGGRMRLDLHHLTVVTDTAQGPAPMWRIGSAENHIGEHLIAHLALHRYFTLNELPVPRVLMLDQPTQAYYPSDAEKEAGVPTSDTDREAVQRIFRLLYDVAAELSPNFQVIVCDHANLTDGWFQESIAANWRGGEKLIPAAWVDA